MKAGELITLASAHGIDLRQAAAATTRIQTQRASKWALLRRSLEANACIDPPTNSASGRSSHVTTKSEWTIAELGQAAHGVPQTPFLAAMYSYAGDRQAKRKLQLALSAEAIELCMRHGWPTEVRSESGELRFYLEGLAGLVLLEDANQPIFRGDPSLYARVLGVAESVWQKILTPRFELVKNRYIGWLNTAEYLIQERISAWNEQ